MNLDELWHVPVRTIGEVMQLDDGILREPYQRAKLVAAGSSAAVDIHALFVCLSGDARFLSYGTKLDEQSLVSDPINISLKHIKKYIPFWTIDTFLRAVELCPDERLKPELGIFDNFPVLVDADYDKVAADFESSENYQFTKKIFESYDSISKVFDFHMGTVKVNVRPYPYFDLNIASRERTAEQLELQEQLQRFPMTIMLHDYQERQWEGVSNIRAIANVLRDVVSYLKEKQFSFCLPHSRGNHLHEYDRIIFHEAG